MNIVVVLRALRDPASFAVNRKAQKVFVNREAFVGNPADMNALEAALVLAAAAGPPGLVTAVSCGDEPAADVLYQARAMGASRAVWVKEPALAQADAAVHTRVLLSSIPYLGDTDLVMLGASVLDADLAQVGPRLASALGWTFADQVYEVRLAADRSGRLVLAVRAQAGRDFREVGASLPAVLSIAADCNRPRYAAAASIIRVYAEPGAVEVITPDALGIEPAGLEPTVARRGESFPPERQFGQPQATPPAAVAEQLAAALLRQEAGAPWI